MNVLEIPGYAEALARERFVRDAAFLGLTETVYGVELKPFTLRHYLVLRAIRSPLLSETTPSPVDLAQFLWVVSKDYCTSGRSMSRFVRVHCRKFQPPPHPLFFRKRYQKRFNEALIEMAKALKEVRAYLAEAMMDRPPTNPMRGWSPDYYSEVVFWVASLGYHYSADEVLDMPLKVLFQFLQALKEQNTTKPAMFNPSDKVRADWMMEQNGN